MNKFFFVLSFCWLVVFCVHAQQYNMIRYEGEVVGSDLVKAVVQDKNGLIWIGTDNGLVSYDGITFKNYFGSVYSQYIKSFFKDQQNQIYVVYDLGIGLLQQSEDSVFLTSVFEGARKPEKGKVWYPKDLHTTKDSALWISEPGAISKFSKGKLKRYGFSSQDITTSFVQSFSFFEWENELTICSQRGNFYNYNKEEDVFDTLQTSVDFHEISHVTKVDDQYWMATRQGLFKISKTEGALQFNKIFDEDNLSFIKELTTGTVMVASNTGMLYLGYKKKVGWQFELVTSGLSVVESIFEAGDGSVWVSTESGVYLFHTKSFYTPTAEHSGAVIQSIEESESQNSIFFCTKNELLELQIATNAVRSIKKDLNAQYLGLESIENGLWISNANQVIFMDEERNFHTKSLGERENLIFELDEDPKGNVWVAQESIPQLLYIDKKLNVKVFGPQHGINKEMNIVRANDKGVFVGGLSKDHYLYYQAPNDSVFYNISIQAPFLVEESLEVNDIAFGDSVVWLATSQGLLRYTYDSLEKIELSLYSNLQVGNVEKDPINEWIWFSNTKGLFRYDLKNKTFSFYNESVGLKSNTIINRGLFIDSKANLWLSLARGISKSTANIRTLTSTPQPVLNKVVFDGKNQSTKKRSFITNKALAFGFTTAAFPLEDVRFSYQLFDDQQNILQSGAMKKNELSFSFLGSGKYRLVILAHKSGNFIESSPLEMQFTIVNPFYKSIWFFTAIFLVVGGLMYLTRWWTIKIQLKRQLKLEMLINERTASLRNSNALLASRNHELDKFVYSASHDLMAPLKSIRGLANVGMMESKDDDQNLLFSKITESAYKLESFIKDVINYSRNARLLVKKKNILLRPFIEEIVHDLSYSDNFDSIHIEIKVAPDLFIKMDEVRLRIVLNNLLSNAIKFQDQQKKKQEVVVSCQVVKGRCEIVVQDNGIGIKKEYQRKVFDMFYRANNKANGSGLGLYILRDAVSKMKGTVQLKSEEYLGSTFVINIPA